MSKGNLDSKKKIILILIIVSCFWMVLCIRVGIIQFVEGEKWKAKAERQLYVSRTITANRGTIYDRTVSGIL